MFQYFVRRFLLVIPTMLGVSLIIFVIMHLVPGGPLEQALSNLQMGSSASGEVMQGGGQLGVQTIPEDALEAMKKAFGYDKPLYLRYLHWLWRVGHLDFGESYKTYEPVWDKIKSRFPVSIYFGSIGFALSYLICIPLGVMKGIRHGSAFDVSSSAIVFIGYSIPGWAMGVVLLVLLGGGSFWNVFPLGGFRSATWEDLPSWAQRYEVRDEVCDEFGDFQWEKMTLVGKSFDQLYHTVLPIFCYMVGAFATLTVLTKNSLMENLAQDYVRTAFAKGLRERRVVFLHVLRNSLIPIATGLGHAIGIFMAGSYLIEYTFNIRGLGLLGFEALIERDYPVALAILVINAFLSVVGNIISDMLYAAIDPRIRFE